jgi:hypothetical protein
MDVGPFCRSRAHPRRCLGVVASPNRPTPRNSHFVHQPVENGTHPRYLADCGPSPQSPIPAPTPGRNTWTLLATRSNARFQAPDGGFGGVWIANVVLTSHFQALAIPKAREPVRNGPGEGASKGPGRETRACSLTGAVVRHRASRFAARAGAGAAPTLIHSRPGGPRSSASRFASLPSGPPGLGPTRRSVVVATWALWLSQVRLRRLSRSVP